MSERYGAQIEDTSTTSWQQFEGQVVDGQFLLRRCLGGSDHTAVFLTDYNLAQPRKAAIKLILETPENAHVQLSRWELTSDLSHPHLLAIYRTGRGEVAGTKVLYIVMEYADEDLSQILPQRALTPAEAREMLRPALDALAYIHAKGFVHGHLKPSNIMACTDQLKLSSDALCEPDEPMPGVGHYDPPESAASPAGDVWSLGATLVEILTQHVPVSEDARNPDPQVPKTIPEPFFDVARGCLRGDPNRRWKVADIASHLQFPVSAHLTAHRGVHQAVPEEPASPARAQHSTPHPRSHALPAIAVVLMLTAALVVPKFLKHRADNAPASSQALETPEPQATAREAEPPPAPQQQQQPEQPPQEQQVLDQQVKAQPVNQQQEAQQQLSALDSSPESAPAARDIPASASPVRSADRPAIATAPSAPAVEAPKAASTAPAVPAAPPEPAPASVEGEIVHQALPTVLEKARASIHGTVRVNVKVSVNSAGDVDTAVLDSPGPSQYFANLAVQAARQWKFQPGSATTGNWLLHFQFTNDDTKVSPSHRLP